MSNSWRRHRLQHTRLPCPSPSPGVSSDWCSLSQWCHPTISSCVIPYSSMIQRRLELWPWWHKAKCQESWWEIRLWHILVCISSVQFSCSVISDSLLSHGLQHARLPCPSPSPGDCSNSCPSSQWCHPTISPSVISFPSCLQSFPASWSYF